MKKHIIPSLLVVDCCGVIAQGTSNLAQADTTHTAIETPAVVAPSEKTLPTWYVFKIKVFHKVTYSDDRTSAIIEGVTMKDKEFKVKMVWDASFQGNHQRCVDE